MSGVGHYETLGGRGIINEHEWLLVSIRGYN